MSTSDGLSSRCCAGRCRIETLVAERVEVVRPPLPDKASRQARAADGRELPIGVELRALVIDDLHLPTTLLPFESHWKVAGNATAPADLAKGRWSSTPSASTVRRAGLPPTYASMPDGAPSTAK